MRIKVDWTVDQETVYRWNKLYGQAFESRSVVDTDMNVKNCGLE